MDVIALIICLAGLPAGVAWERWHKRLAAKAEKKRKCNHHWREPECVFGDYWYRNCSECHGQQQGRRRPDGKIHWTEHVQ